MLSFESSPEEEFWKERMIRYIDDCSSTEELKQVATLLVKIAATRQAVIKGLVRDALDQMTTEFKDWNSELGISAE
jgi:hypothetical protein